VPEIQLPRGEFHTDVLLTIARTMDGNNAALRGLGGVIVYKNEGLPYEHNLFQVKQGTMAVHGLRMGSDREFVAGIRLTKYRQRHCQRNPQRSTAFLAAKVKQGHFDLDLRAN
jgi:hypothetical protein